MPRPKTFENPALLSLRLEQENYEQLGELAENEGLNVGEFVRQKLIKPCLKKAGYEFLVYSPDEKEEAPKPKAKGKKAAPPAKPAAKAKAAPTPPAKKSKVKTVTPKPSVNGNGKAHKAPTKEFWTPKALKALKLKDPAKYKKVKRELAAAEA